MLTIWSYGTPTTLPLQATTVNAGTRHGIALGLLFTYAMGGSSPLQQDIAYVKAGNYGNENIVCTKMEHKII